MDILELPFNEHVGLTKGEYEGAEVICLDPQRHHENHLGTIHASALYALAEAASGYVLLHLDAIDPEQALAVLRSATIKYRRPAEGRVMAVANLEDHAVDKFRQQLSQRGRALLPIGVRILDRERQEILTGTLDWFVNRRTSSE